MHGHETTDALPRFMIRHRLALVVAAHGVLFALALFAAFSLAYNFRWTIRVGGEPYRWFATLYLPLLVIVVPIKLVVFRWTRQYRGSWRYVGLRDLYTVISASLMGTFLFLLAYFLLENIWSMLFGHILIDRSAEHALRQSAIFSLDWAATIVFVSAARILVRFYHEDIQPQRLGRPREKVLIVGAGDTAEAVLRELLRMRRERYECVGLVDDDVAQLNSRIHGVEVIGRTSQIREICREVDVQEVVIAYAHTTPKAIRELIEQCEGTGVRFRTVPAVSDVMEGRVQVSQIRDVEIADLLGREPVKLDTVTLGNQLRDRIVLVTGAGGSIGSELCRQIAAFLPRRLILIEKSENNLFEIDRELRRCFVDLEVKPCVADITDRARLGAIFAMGKPSVVFHAAAHKHVPMMETNAGEAVKNNIVGTMQVADAAIAHATEKMVMISTDKAVNPTSVMGCTKRVAEMYVQGLTGRASTQFVTVRFGNVLGSSGSVVPIFREQILRGGPVTVTHPDMMRYFMTIPEAAQLVLQAGTMGKGGEIYVLHMGEAVKIVDLARDMISLSGLRPGVDVEITFTGKRPGEKLFEELSHTGEHIGDTANPKIGIWKHRVEDWEAVRRGMQRLVAMADSASNDTLRAELKTLVPEYSCENGTPEIRGGPAPLIATEPCR